MLLSKLEWTNAQGIVHKVNCKKTTGTCTKYTVVTQLEDSWQDKVC